MPGELPENVVRAVLGALPMDLTYIDEADIIRYYSDYRIFKRSPDVLGTPVQKCHKPENRAEVDRVIDELRSGRKDMSEYPAAKGGRKVIVRYIALKNKNGKYSGLVEICEWAD